MRTLVGHSHKGRYSYWRDPDRYIYQRNEHTQVWIGWICALSAWENIFSKSNWITLCDSSSTPTPESIDADPSLLDDSVTEVY